MRTNTQQRIRNLNSRTELTDAAIRAVAPSVFAGQAIPSASDRYSFLPTIRIVRAMREAGWTPVQASEQTVRSESRVGYQRHAVKFWRTEQKAVAGEYMPEITLINSHDRTSAYQLPVGIYRFTCSNGMMVDDSTCEAMRVRHSGCTIQEVVDASMLVLEKLPNVGHAVERMRSRLLTGVELQTFATRALSLRYDDLAKAPIEPSQLLKVRRSEDNGDNLWATFNRVQENLTIGGLRNRDRSRPDGTPMPKMRAVLGLTQNVSLNKELWSLAQTFLN